MKAAILGTGSWASAFGRHLTHKWERVVLWGIEADQVKAIIVPEMNLGQLAMVAEATTPTEVVPFTQVNGKAISPASILARCKELL